MDEIFHIRRFQTCVALAADLLLVGENGDGGVFRVVAGERCHERRICADAVVVSVGAYHGTVEAHVACLGGGNEFYLCREEVGFHKTVFFIEQSEHIELDQIVALFLIDRKAAHHNVEIFGGNGCGKRFLFLLASEMGKEIGHAELRIAFLLANAHFQPAAVGKADNAVHGQRYGRPLVFLDAAVVMGLEHGDFIGFIKGIGFEVESRGVDVSDGKTHALAHRFAADDRKHDCFAPVDLVDLFARFVDSALLKGNEASDFGKPYRLCDGLALGLCRVEKFLVVVAEFIGASELIVGQLQAAVFRVVGKFFAELLRQCFFFHLKQISSQKQTKWVVKSMKRQNKQTVKRASISQRTTGNS